MEKGKTVIIGITGYIFTDQRIIRIATSLVENGYHVIVYYRRFFKFKTVNISHNLPFETRILMDDVNDPFGVFNRGVGFYAVYNLLLFFRLLFSKADIFYAVDSDTLPAFSLISFLKRKPLVFDSHEYFAEVPELAGSPLKKNIWHWVTKLGVKRSSARLTVGPKLAGVLSERYGKPFVSVRNVPAYKASVLQDVGGHEPPVILYQGALNVGRELELLITAMYELKEFHCIIAGEGDLSQELRSRVGSMSRVKFAGLLSPEALNEITKTCFAGFNLLSEGSLSYHYSLSNKYFDYMQAGVPSISSKLPEYMALNAEFNCGVCIDNSVEALISTLRNWLHDKTHYKKLKENAIIAAKTLNWENEQKLLLDLFKTL